MLDIVNQDKKIKNKINQGFQKILKSGSFIGGNYVTLFKNKLQKYLNVKHVIPCANGTDALQITLMSLNLNPGDEIITADFTFASTVEVIHLLGLQSVLIDVDYNTFNLSIDSLKKALTSKTKVIIPIHLFGQCSNMEEIMNCAKKNNLYVIEDTAQALGSEYIFLNGIRKKAGTIGTVGTTSFFPSKNLGGYGDGGAVYTNDDELANKIKAIANHGMYKKYYHDILGVNSRLDALQAVVLNEKLTYLDFYNKSRIKVANYYDNKLNKCKDLIIPTRYKYSTHIFHQYTLKIKNGKRKKLQMYLLKKKFHQ